MKKNKYYYELEMSCDNSGTQIIQTFKDKEKAQLRFNEATKNNNNCSFKLFECSFSTSNLKKYCHEI